MCGICGFTGKANQNLLKQMTLKLIHRGPDEDGFYAGEKINLGMRRLSIIDLKTGQQPVCNEDQSIWAVFNGEVYNFSELREQLELKGHVFSSDHSDTEVIVHLYEEYGADFPDKINGMFSIALWDQPKEMLILVRDRMGVKPLFYALANSVLIFASEIKSILVHPGYHREMNYEAVYHYFSFKNIPAPLTCFLGINSLLPGEILFFSQGKIAKQRWWKINFKVNKDYDEEQAKTKIMALLEDATRLRMRSDVPIGAYLSGGLDSSTVVALMSRFTKVPLQTFSLGYEDEFKNKEADLYYARKISQQFHTEHHEYIMSHQELIADLENIVSAFDQPFSGVISTYFLTKLIKKHVKVALSGDGADELFGSYLSHRTANPMFYFKRLHEQYQNNTLTEKEKKLFAPCSLKYLAELYDKSGGNEIDWRYNLYLFSDQEKNALLTDNFKKHCLEVNTYKLVKNYFNSLSATDPLNRILELEWNTQLPDQVLSFVDFLSMAQAVEVRSPFLDYRLVEFVAALPGEIKIKDGKVKDILKKAVINLLPADVINRPKEGFVMPIFEWMTASLADYCQNVLAESRLAKHKILDYQVVKNMFKRYNKGEKELAAKLWNLVMFQLWWEKYFD